MTSSNTATRQYIRTCTSVIVRRHIGTIARVLINSPEYSGPCGCIPDLWGRTIQNHHSFPIDMSNWLLHTIIVGPRRVDRGNERYRGVYGWGQRRVMGLVGQALWPEYRFRRTASVGKIFTRTLTARIHSAFSSVRNALHSFRIAGFVQRPLP